MKRIEIKISDVRFIILGIAVIVAGIAFDYALPWVNEINLNKIESCIADMHFRNATETQFQQCVTPDLKQIQAVQQLTLIITIFYSMGGVFIGLGFMTEAKNW